jgi:RNA polymerase sigma-70 factor, ECF subfamily
MSILQQRMRFEWFRVAQGHLSNLCEPVDSNKLAQGNRAALLLTLWPRGASTYVEDPVEILGSIGGRTAMAGSAAARFEAMELASVNTAVGTEADDEALVRAAQGGDRAAFGLLYQRYVRMVHGILLARVPGIAAEDLVHDVFLQALPKLGALRDASRFGGWLAAIARNCATDFYRRAKSDSTSEEEQTAIENVEDPQGSVGVEDGIALLNAVRQLPEAYREPLMMRFVEGMSGPEIAARTGLKHGSVRVNLHRGMQMLREKWREV